MVNIKEKVFENPLIKFLINELSEEEKEPTLKAVNDLIERIEKNGNALITRIQEAENSSKNKESK